MINNGISDSESLSMQIAQLKADRTGLEEELNRSFNEITQLIFKPAIIIHDKPADKPGVKRDLINLSKIVLNRGTNYIIEQRFGKPQKMSDFLTSLVLELITVPLINKSVNNLFSGIDRYLFEETECVD